MSKFDRNWIKDGWEKLCTNKQTDKPTDTTKIMVTWLWTNDDIPSVLSRSVWQRKDYKTPFIYPQTIFILKPTPERRLISKTWQCPCTIYAILAWGVYGLKCDLIFLNIVLYSLTSRQSRSGLTVSLLFIALLKLKRVIHGSCFLLKIIRQHSTLTDRQTPI